MTTLSAMGVRHLRALLNIDPPINLTPITVLLGKNSAGKSTFARLLPLLRQSAERRKRGPILWFGDLVDFGTFEQAVTRGQTIIELILKLDSLSPRSSNVLNTWTQPGYSSRVDIDCALIRLTLNEDQSTGATYASELSITIAGSIIKLIFESAARVKEVWVDQNRFTWDETKSSIISEPGAIIPRIRFIEKRKSDEKRWYFGRNLWRNELVELIQQYVHGNTSRGTIAKIASQIPLVELSLLPESLKAVSGPPSWDNVLATHGKSPAFLKHVVRSQLISSLEVIMERVDIAISEIAKAVRYIKPVRATAERYYRRADLAVSEIDPDGQNLPMFLDSLTPTSYTSFREWLKENLNIRIDTKKEGAQVILMAQGPDDTVASNVADMGFGISQILPIAAQLWASSARETLGFPESSFVVMEQPELHLHPAYQGTIADVLAGVVRQHDEETTSPTQRRRKALPKLIVETHSQQLVNRLGALVENGTLKSTDVSVVLFEPDATNIGTSKVRVATFDAGGVLINWPYGFFEADE